MIKSMTGFGRSEITEGKRKVSVEIKAVNHRYLEVSIKMPKKLNVFEAQIRSELKNYIQRGKVDLFINYEDSSENNVTVKYNKDIAQEYYNFLKQMTADFGLEDDIRVSTLSRYPEVFTMDEGNSDEEEVWKVIKEALDKSCESFVESRIKEGENLKNDLLLKLDDMKKNVDYIAERSPKIIEEYKNKLSEKVKELLGDASVDEGRIATEVTIFADKICVDEEMVRLKSHIEAVRNELISGGSIGRKLDFLAQEMNREANTILSKANDLTVSNCGIELKTTIEKIREQIQNIE